MGCLVNSTIAICQTPELRRVDLGEEELKWCFACRKRLIHKLKNIVFDSNYYDPETIWECPSCLHDRTRFGDA